MPQRMKFTGARRCATVLLFLLLLLGLYSAAEAASGNWGYRKYTENGISTSSSTETCYEATLVSEAGTNWSEGWYVLNDNVAVDKRIEVSGRVHLILVAGKTLKANWGINIGSDASLSIYGGGTLIANEGQNPGVGIGTGTAGASGGNLYIHGGTIKAWGGDHDAGIGSGDGKNSVNVTIYGGFVEAHGGNSAAGIGDGRGASSGYITIYGGTIYAKGGHYGAGIGGGNGQGNPMRGGHHTKAIKIYGGLIDAKGGDDAAGIGGGEGGNCGTIVISNSNSKNAISTTVYAGAGSNGAGIGNGECESTGDGGTITINGGKIFAYGIFDGAAIGGGDNGHVDKIVINGGDIEAYGGKNAAGIGGGYDESSKEIIINGGDVWAYGEDGAAIGGGQYGDGGRITITGGNVHAYGDGGNNDDGRGGSGHGAGIGGGYYSGDGGTITISGGTVYAESIRGAGIGGGDCNHNGTIRTGEGADLTVSGGHVTAKSVYYGIGTGMEAYRWNFSTEDITSAHSLTITGGTVDAWGYVAGFGGDSGTLKLDGGTLNLHCWADCPEANYWRNGFAGLWLLSKDAGSVTVNNGTLNVWGGDYGGILLGHESRMIVRGGSVNVWTAKGPGIGNDGKGPDVDIYGGNVHIFTYDWDARLIGGSSGKGNGHLNVDYGLQLIVSSAGSDSADPSWGHKVLGCDREKELQNGNRHGWISTCDHSGNGKENYTVTETTHTLNCKWCCKNIGPENHTPDATGKCTVCGFHSDDLLRSLTFMPGEGTGEMEIVKVIPETEYPMPVCAFDAPENKIFDIWSVKKAGEAEEANDEGSGNEEGNEEAEPLLLAEGEPLLMTENMVATALWKSLYTVTFDSAGGTEVEPQTVVDGETAACPEDVTRENYALRGWKLKGSDQLYDFATPVTADITLVAVWTNQYWTVDVYGTNNTCTATVGYPQVFPDKNIIRGELATVTVAVPEHYLFAGWYEVVKLSDSGQVLSYNQARQLSNELTYTFTVNESMRIAAVFALDPDYSRSFQIKIADGIEHGTITMDRQLVYYDEENDCWHPAVGATVALIVNPEEGYWPDTIYYTWQYTDPRDGYSEKRVWEIDPDENGIYRFTMPEADLTLFASFDNKEYSLTVYTSNVGCSNTSPIAEITVTPPPSGQTGYRVHQSATVTTQNAQAGYTFRGWYPVTGVSSGRVTSYDPNSLLSSDPEYAFEFGKENIRIAAVYRDDRKEITVVPVNGAEFINQADNPPEIYDHVHAFAMAAGESLSLSAVDADRVVRWVNASSKTLSTGGDLIYEVTEDMTIFLVYQDRVKAPVFSPAASTYDREVKVRITCPTEDATIFYTTDGSEPTAASPRYTGPITVSSTMTIKAIGIAANMANSRIAEATYTFNYPIVILQPGYAGDTPVEGNETTIYCIASEIGDLNKDALIYGQFYHDEEDRILFCYPGIPYNTPEGYVFTGWQKADDEHACKPGTLVDALSCTLVAQWAPAYTLTAVVMPEYAQWQNVPAAACEGESILPMIRIRPEEWRAGYRPTVITVTDKENKVISQISKTVDGVDLSKDDAVHHVGDGSMLIVLQPFDMPDSDVTIKAEYSLPIPFGPITFTLPDNLEHIEANAFEDDTKISVVYIPDSCTYIGSKAFKGCTGLTQIRLPVNCVIAEDSFIECGQLIAIYGTDVSESVQQWAQKQNIPIILYTGNE